MKESYIYTSGSVHDIILSVVMFYSFQSKKHLSYPQGSRGLEEKKFSVSFRENVHFGICELQTQYEGYNTFLLHEYIYC